MVEPVCAVAVMAVDTADIFKVKKRKEKLLEAYQSASDSFFITVIFSFLLILGIKKSPLYCSDDFKKVILW